MARIVAFALVLVFGSTGAGCSPFLVRGPDPFAPEPEPLQCTASDFVPNSDLAAGLGLIAASLTVFNAPTHWSEGPKNYAFVSLPIAAALLASSRWGTGRVDDCRYWQALRRRCEAGACGAVHLPQDAPRIDPLAHTSGTEHGR